jgi:GNAT superfamily N-acetyltransferase
MACERRDRRPVLAALDLSVRGRLRDPGSRRTAWPCSRNRVRVASMRPRGRGSARRRRPGPPRPPSRPGCSRPLGTAGKRSIPFKTPSPPLPSLAERQGLAWPAKEMRCRGDRGPFWDAVWLGIAVVMAVLVHRYLKQPCSRSWVGSIDDSSRHHLAAPVPPPLEDPGAPRCGPVDADPGRHRAGFVVVDDAEVEQLYADRSWRGRGVAERLLRHAEAVIGQRGRRTAWLAVVGWQHACAKVLRQIGLARPRPLHLPGADCNRNDPSSRQSIRARGKRRLRTRSAVAGRSTSHVKGAS